MHVEQQVIDGLALKQILVCIVECFPGRIERQRDQLFLADQRVVLVCIDDQDVFHCAAPVASVSGRIVLN